MGRCNVASPGGISDVVNLTLAPFDETQAGVVLGWIRTRQEADRWASAGHRDLEAALLREWHSDPDVRPFVCVEDGLLVGYGEVWDDAEADEAELARIVVAPDRRGEGVGRRLVELLVEQARAAGFDDVWLRVVPDNAAAIACYRGAGFIRATAEEETAFNEGQPTEYVWMRASPNP
jgi:ribosomal protein S18 acetylase RimI-like enzyme